MLLAASGCQTSADEGALRGDVVAHCDGVHRGIDQAAAAYRDGRDSVAGIGNVREFMTVHAYRELLFCAKVRSTSSDGRAAAKAEDVSVLAQSLDEVGPPSSQLVGPERTKVIDLIDQIAARSKEIRDIPVRGD
ncbi:MAG: hypothetical protein HOW73_35370 [Polyangiaceae bacterium]|nr:hypothetical protein [Polyangiaceae bacterium]